MNAVVILTKLFLPDLVSTKGKIMNVASTAAFQPGPYMAIYFASKSFVLSFSEAIASELEETSVTVTAFCPGPTASGFQEKARMFESAMVKGRQLPSAELVARKGYRAMQRGQRVYIPGVKNWLLSQSQRFGPRNLVTRIAKFVSRPV
jgi:short-subunit dehydrogenase